MTASANSLDPPSSATASNTTASATAPDTTASPQLIQTQTFSLSPDRPGEVRVHVSFDIPEEVTALETTLPERTSVVSTDGFSQVDGRTYEWDGATNPPTITYRLAVNRTAEAGGPEGADGEFLFVDVGDWAILQRPGSAVRWTRQGSDPVQFSREAAVDGEGAVGGGLAYLGPFDEYTRSANGQRFRLVVPAGADMRADREEVFDALTAASGTLAVGDRDERVLVVVAPTGEVSWAVRGLETRSDFYVRDTEPVGEPTSVWLHEYVHTRQDWTPASDVAWLGEGTATYYAALLALDQGRIDFADFADLLGRGTKEPQSSSVLAEPSTWRNHANYRKGALVAGELDRQIRATTGRETSFGAVMRRLNAHEGTLTGDDLARYVADVAGEEVRTATERYTTTEEAPAMWDRDAHEEAFGVAPAKITYEIDESGLAVSGPHGSRDVGSPPTVVAGESLTIPVTVRNEGGTAGDYEATLTVDGRTVATNTGRLQPNDSAAVTFEHPFETAGEYEVTVGTESLTVLVREPATLSVTDIRADSRQVAVGESVTVTATVENPDDVPGSRDVPVTLDGEDIGVESVTLDAGESASVSVTVELPEPGVHTIAIGEATVEVEATRETVDTPTPGFGPAVAVVALATAAVLLGRKRRS